VSLRLVLADDHVVLLEGLKALLALEEDMDVVATCLDGGEVLASVQTWKPDVLVMDAAMPEVGGLEALEVLDGAGVRPPTVVLSATLDDAMLLRCVELGVDGLVLKESAADSLVQAIRSVARGESSIPELLRLRVEELHSRRAEVKRAHLTPREREVAVMAASGLPNKRIAGRLGLAEGTVKLHLHSAFRKLGVSNRTQLALIAHEEGWE